MPLTGKIMSLFTDKEKTTPLFPRTKVKAISDDDGVGLDAIINDINIKINDNAKAIQYTAIVSTAWTGDAAPYTQEIEVAGILSDDEPIVDLVPSDDYDISQIQLEEWAKIYKIVASNGTIIVYASEKTTVALPIQLLVSRDKIIDTGIIDGVIIMDGSVTAEKLDPNIDLGSLDWIPLWENASPTSEFAEQEVVAAGIGDEAEYPYLLYISSAASGYLENAAGTVFRSSYFVVDTGTGYANYRRVELRDGAVYFGDNLEALIRSGSYSPTTTNTNNIPIAIFGVRGAK